MKKALSKLQNPALAHGHSMYKGRIPATDYVDMGLPSGTKWAKTDIDVSQPNGFALSEFQYEKSFFSWGNIVGHNPINETTFEYNFGSVNAQEPWYEGQPYGDTPGNTLTGNIPVSEEFDAARAILGYPWRDPTSDDFNELIADSIYIDATGTEIPAENINKLVTVNNIIGIYLQSKTNGNRLFLSASGSGVGSSWSGRSTYGFYWSSSHGSSREGRRLRFYNGGVSPQNYSDRCDGFAIRAVTK